MSTFCIPITWRFWFLVFVFISLYLPLFTFCDFSFFFSSLRSLLFFPLSALTMTMTIAFYLCSSLSHLAFRHIPLPGKTIALQHTAGSSKWFLFCCVFSFVLLRLQSPSALAPSLWPIRFLSLEGDVSCFLSVCVRVCLSSLCSSYTPHHHIYETPFSCHNESHCIPLFLFFSVSLFPFTLLFFCLFLFLIFPCFFFVFLFFALSHYIYLHCIFT